MLLLSLVGLARVRIEYMKTYVDVRRAPLYDRSSSSNERLELSLEIGFGTISVIAGSGPGGKGWVPKGVLDAGPVDW